MLCGRLGNSAGSASGSSAIKPETRTKSRSADSKTPRSGEKTLAPLLLHFDVNKTVIQSDSIQMKTIEEGVREGISELFWGYMRKDKDKMVWQWTKSNPSCNPPKDLALTCMDGAQLVTYSEYCKKVVKDKADRKEAVKFFKLVSEQEVRDEMEKLMHVTVNKMQLPTDIKRSRKALDAGLRGSTLMMFPAIFHFVAVLQRSKRTFGILFRSFGADHDKIKYEWNAFCEMRHPVFSSLIQGLGPMDGSLAGVPDRRIHGIHTLYRDATGPILLVDTFTNGPQDDPWDAWARQKPKPKGDSRAGREFIKNVLKADTVQGIPNIQKWMKAHLLKQATGAIKDDWAWWQWNEENPNCAKLLTLIGGKEETKQLFFDDNIEHNDARIVDCRDSHGNPVPLENSMNKLITKVNPVEALLDDEYFLRKLQRCHGEHLDVGASLLEFQRQLTELEEQKESYAKQVQALNMQLRNLTEENRRMKLMRRIHVRDEAQLRDLLVKDDLDLNLFGQDRYKKVSELYMELDQGHCWLEHDDQGKLVRVLEMLFMKIQYKDFILIESHEQDTDSRIQSRNYLPGVNKTLKEQSFQPALERFFETGLEVNLKHCVKDENTPIFVPEAPNQVTGCTQAYPIPAKVQQSQATFLIPEKEVEAHEKLLSKIGLPGGKHFTTREKDLHGGTITRFWRWDKIATWEATSSQMTKGTLTGPTIDITATCDKLFRGHPRREVYENLLLQMFESFTANKLCGGFSGSVVIRVQPFESDGRPGEPCIVKLDAGDAIREEYVNSVNVFDALPDRAARILGEAVYAKNQEEEEFGAFRLELAGACWNVPELAQGSANLLSTFKDLLLYESEQALLGSGASASDVRPFGNVNSVLAETFGPGGVVSSLRKGGNGLRRATRPLLWGHYTLKGKEGKYNPYTAKKGEYAPEPAMRKLYKKYFGQDMPDLKDLVVGRIKPQLMDLASSAHKEELCPLVGLAHGDLNAANIMIDALDAVWLIDFATSVELPLFTDMCKFEMACLFEYATIPITPKLLVEFASTSEEMWQSLNIGDWLRVSQDIAVLLLQELVALPPERLAALMNEDLEKIIEDVAAKSGRAPHKQKGVVRALKARLVTNEAMMDRAFNYCADISNSLLQGSYLGETLDIRSAPPSDGPGSNGAASLRWFMELCVTIRRFMVQDIMNCLREQSSADSLQPCDALSLQMWLPFLRESYRVLGYRDICPQQKVWSVFHCSLVAGHVLREIDTLRNSWRNLRSLPVMDSLQHDLAARKRTTRLSTSEDQDADQKGIFSVADSHWAYAHRDIFPYLPHPDRVVRKMHSVCPVYKDKAGIYSPVFEALTLDDRQLRLEFNPHPDKGMDLFLDEVDADGRTLDGSRAETQSVSIGCLTGSKGSSTVVLKTHLFFLTAGLLQHKVQSMISSAEDPVAIRVLLSEWSGGVFMDKAEAMEKHRRSAAPGNSPASPDRGQRRLSTVTNVPDEFHRCMMVNCVARDAAGKENVKVRLVLGNPACCYPCGSKICIDGSTVPLGKTGSPEVVIMSMTELSGEYRIRDAGEPTPETEREFDPQPCNHVMLAPCQYKVGQRIMFCEDETWADGEIVETATETNGYRYRLQPKSSKPAELGKQFSDDLLGYDLKPDTEQDGQEPPPRLLRHLNVMNSSCHRLPAAVFEDEVHRMKVYCRARHSYIIDALSGMRLDVKECAMPTLHIMSRVSGGGETQDRKGKARMTSRSPSFKDAPSSASSNASVSTAASGVPGDLSSLSDYRLGWQALTTAVDKFEKAVPTCTPNAFLVLGSPGSGKTCLICRLIMDCLERQPNLVPLQLPVADLVKRTSQEAESSEMDSVAVYTWFDKYLRITFGEDSNRYRMICQAIQMHRAMFLFEGLEDAGGVAPVIERCIKDFVQDRHFVVVTSRPLISGSSNLEDLNEYMLSMRLQNVTDEQKRSIAHARLGLEGLGVFDKFFKQLREGYSFGVPKDDEDSGEKDEQDVFGNPMMLSMLICYLKSRQEELDEQRANKDEMGPRSSVVETQNEGEGVTLTEVYRVALDVMIQRVQSKQQAARHQKEQHIEACKRILQKMAMAMQQQQRLTIEAKEVESILESDLKNEWATLKSAVEAGQALFLRVAAADAGKCELSFLVKGFQNFFAASEIQHDGGVNLPDLVALFTEQWWAPMLEMLAEYSPPRYVRLIENRLQKFEPVKGDSFLHIAARVGHRPVFTYLKLFKEQYQHNLWARSSFQVQPLHVAAEKGNTHLCALMLDHKALIDSENADGVLAMHVAMQHGHFPTAKFLLERWVETHGGSPHKLGNSKKRQAEALASRILSSSPGSQPLSEAEFLEQVNETFVELKFFGKADKADKLRELGALLAVFWISADHYEQFVRGQDMESRLSQGSWAKLQDWTKNTVGLTKSPATVGAMLVFLAIFRLGNVKAFKSTFAPEFDHPDKALAHILQTTPILIPSFSRLDDHLQQMILSAMKADFNFGQFLQAENLPANLFNVKEILSGGEGSVNILGFFLFRIFAAMCGIFGMKTLEGSVFMTDKMYTNFKVGLDQLQHLMDESAQTVYNRFLAERARAQGLTFNEQDMESRARVRLACLSRIFEVSGGREVTDAFNKLEESERKDLARFLNADGITEKPGFLLSFSPQLLEYARNSTGLMQGMRMLLKVYQECQREYETSDQRVVSVFVDDLANLAKNCTDAEVFAFTKFEISRTSGRNSDSQGTVKISPWQLVKDEAELEKLTEAGTSLASEVLQSSVREPGFLKRLDQAFPEMRYLSGEGEVQIVLKQTRGSLLSVYWTITEQAEAFRRGQTSDKKLSDKSFHTIVQWSLSVAEQEVLDAALVAMVVSSLGKVPKFKEQLCPGMNIDGHKAVLRNVMETSPNVLPSFARLEPRYRKLVQQCLTQDFIFEQFLQAENLPANLNTVKDMLQEAERQDDLSCQLYLDFFLFEVFAELAGSLGNDSLEGSVYMTEDRFTNFQLGIEHIRRLGAEGGKWSATAVYDAYLAERARALSLSFDEKNPESRAIARLACLSRVHDPFAGIKVSEAFKALTAKEREALTKYLNVDGVKEKPGFILCKTPDFLENAWANKEVGLLPAMRILLRIYEGAEKEFQGSTRSVITIQLGNLTLFAKEFFGSVAFQDMPFELVKKHGGEALVIPKAWIPVSDPKKLNALRQEGQRLAGEVLKSKVVSEDQFKARFGRIFPELSYFTLSATMQRDQTHGAMIAVYWLISNNHQAFIRGQPQEDQLSRQSWAWIQEWMSQTVKLSTEEAVDATLTFMAIHALGKITEFREELAPGFDAHMHDVALAHVLENQPQVVPSFSGLSPKYQKLIVDSLSVDFQFSQFLQAENVPANLVVVKEKLKPHGDDGLAIFGFRIFAQMCGKLGSKSLKGSLFMTESQFQRFRPGLDALQQLRTLDAGAAYNAFLLNRGSKALSKFASPEHQALVRLLCLASAFVYNDGNIVCEAFEKLSPPERAALTRWLTADGIVSQPGYVLCEVPQLLLNAKSNAAVGLVRALRMLLVVQERCLEAVANYRAPPSKVMVHIGELATWAREAREEEFVQAGINLKIESLTEQKVFTVQVLRPTGDRSHSVEREGVLDLGRIWPWAWTLCVICVIMLCLVCSLIALGISMRVDAVKPLPKSMGIPRRFAFLAFSSVSGLSFMIVGGMCFYYVFRSCACPRTCPAATVSCQEDGPREPFLQRRGYCQLGQIDEEVIQVV